MGKLYKRHLQAGRFHKIVVYSRPTPSEDTKTRQKRREATRSAQRFINCRNQIERLSLKLAANFDSQNAVFMTLTYNNEDIPGKKETVKKQFESFSASMRQFFKKRGKFFEYVRTVEGISLDKAPGAVDPCSMPYELRPWNDSARWEKEGLTAKGGKKQLRESVRFHVHVITNLSPADYETARSLWPYGHVYIAKIRADDADTFPKLASYMTKDTRSGATGNGERCFSCSKGLAKPTISGEWVENDEVEIPNDVYKVFEDERTESQWSYCRRVGYVMKPTSILGCPDQHREAAQSSIINR